MEYEKNLIFSSKFPDETYQKLGLLEGNIANFYDKAKLEITEYNNPPNLICVKVGQVTYKSIKDIEKKGKNYIYHLSKPCDQCAGSIDKKIEFRDYLTHKIIEFPYYQLELITNKKPKDENNCNVL